MKLLIATRNHGKVEELSAGLADLELKFLTLDDLEDAGAFEEVGDNFRACSFLKASFYHSATRLPTLAEDSGLAVDYLGGQPGVKSRRWPGYEATDDELLQLLLERLKGVPPERRTAHFVSAVTFLYDQGSAYTTEHRVSGLILEEPVPPIQPGVPWSSLFYLPDLKKTYSQLTVDEKNKVSHRGGALKKVRPFIINHLAYARH